MSTTPKKLLVIYMIFRYRLTDKTARFFMLKVREVMSSGRTYLILQYIFVNPISRNAKITVDKWSGYHPNFKGLQHHSNRK